MGDNKRPLTEVISKTAAWLASLFEDACPGLVTDEDRARFLAWGTTMVAAAVAVARRSGANRHLEDILADLLVKTWKHRPQAHESGDRLAGWATRVTNRDAISRVREDARIRKQFDRLVRDLDPCERDRRSDPAEIAQRAEERAWLTRRLPDADGRTRLLSQLVGVSSDHLLVLRLSLDEDQTYGQIATRLGWHPSRVKHLAAEAMNSLRAALRRETVMTGRLAASSGAYEAIRVAIEALPRPHSTVAALWYLDGLREETISKRLGPGTRQALPEARALLRARLG